tara:strand:- start:600 stop:815 length:216 start_codon:yes stop_codon:yes gene_type:complete
VSSNETTAEIIKSGYRDFLEVLELYFLKNQLLFGNQPPSADNSLQGQLSQLIDFGASPSLIARHISSRTVA